MGSAGPCAEGSRSESHYRNRQQCDEPASFFSFSREALLTRRLSGMRPPSACQAMEAVPASVAVEATYYIAGISRVAGLFGTRDQVWILRPSRPMHCCKMGEGNS